MEDFHSLLSRFHHVTRHQQGIQFYGDVALCTSVNSILYEDRDLGVRKDPEGINEFIFGSLTTLKDDKVAAWCYTVTDNSSFWITMRTQLMDFFKVAQPVAKELYDEYGKEIAKALLPLLIALIKSRIK